MSLRRRMVNIDVFNDAYRVNARIDVGVGGVHYELTDPNTNYLNLQDVYVSRINHPGNIAGQYAEGAYHKNNVNFLLLQDRNDGIPMAKGSIFTSGKPIPVFFTLPSFEVAGMVLYHGKLSRSQDILFQMQGEFLIIFEAIVSASLYPDITYTGDLLLVNKKRVGIMCLDSFTTE